MPGWIFAQSRLAFASLLLAQVKKKRNVWTSLTLHAVCLCVQEEPAGRQTEGSGHNAAPGGGRGAGGLGHLLPGGTDLQGHVPGVSLHWHAEQRQRHTLVRESPPDAESHINIARRNVSKGKMHDGCLEGDSLERINGIKDLSSCYRTGKNPLLSEEYYKSFKETGGPQVCKWQLITAVTCKRSHNLLHLKANMHENSIHDVPRDDETKMI